MTEQEIIRLILLAINIITETYSEIESIRLSYFEGIVMILARELTAYYFTTMSDNLIVELMKIDLKEIYRKKTQFAH